MKRISILLVCLVVASCGQGYRHKADSFSREQEAQEVDTHTLNQAYLELLNHHRLGMRLTPFLSDSLIESIALGHSKGMALKTRRFSDRGLDKRCRKIKHHLGPLKSCTELIAKDVKDLRSLLQAWLNNPASRKMIEDIQYTHTALGIYKDDDGVPYWTQIFIEL